MIETNPSPAATAEAMPDSAACPVDHTTYSRQITNYVGYGIASPRVSSDENGVWMIRGFDEARQILRSTGVKQAGFNADMIAGTGMVMNMPILYLEGKPHDEQRKRTARFFTPRTVDTKYHDFMEKFADQLIDQLRREKHADLSEFSFKLAVRVAGQIVGITNSRLPGMQQRIEKFFSQKPPLKGPKFLDPLIQIYNNRDMIAFFLLDAQPAINARKKKPQEDVISHLVEQKYSPIEIMAEVVVYAAAGMATTREFISVAVLHMLEHPKLMQRYLIAGDEERYAILHETLRVEPVVSRLSRTATEDLTIESEGQSYTIPSGALINIDIRAANEDLTVVVDDPKGLCPARELHGSQMQEMLMSFGDGPHRCAGAYVAIQETDVFLRKLLSLPGLRIEKQPTITYDDLVSGYEIRNFILAVD